MLGWMYSDMLKDRTKMSASAKKLAAMLGKA